MSNWTIRTPTTHCEQPDHKDSQTPLTRTYHQELLLGDKGIDVHTEDALCEVGRGHLHEQRCG